MSFWAAAVALALALLNALTSTCFAAVALTLADLDTFTATCYAADTVLLALSACR